MVIASLAPKIFQVVIHLAELMAAVLQVLADLGAILAIFHSSFSLDF